MDVVIRKAVKADMPAVLELINELAIFEKEPNIVEVTVDQLVSEGFGETPLFTCFVAEILETIVGMALVYFRFSTWKGRTVHLEDLIVKENIRGKGVGRLLYEAVIKYAHEKGVKRVEWVVLNWNKEAIKFYEQSGVTFHKDWYLVEMEEEGIKRFVKSN